MGAGGENRRGAHGSSSAVERAVTPVASPRRASAELEADTTNAEPEDLGHRVVKAFREFKRGVREKFQHSMVAKSKKN